jgi:nitrous oxide reductase accessory protein NosL
MRALILVAAAALAVSACSKNEAAENTMNVDETLTTENVVANDTMAVDAANGMDANMSMDANGLNAAEATDLNTNAPDTNVANGM